MNQISRCWCGNTELPVFSPLYRQCSACGTLITSTIPAQDNPHVADDNSDFYGRQYWFKHQEQDLGFANIVRRARADISERCLHWLRTLLKYKLPPGTVLELGGAHSGFVALLQQSGFQATGLELSPWVVEFARQTFDIPMLLGPIEEQTIEPASLDAIVLMDVLEHLPDPVGTMRHCLHLLKPAGILLIQTPCYPESRSYEDMVAQADPFLEQFKANEHLFLFSRSSLREMFRRLKADQIVFEPAMFGHYDMFLAVSRLPQTPNSTEIIEHTLSTRPGGRLIQAMLDLHQQVIEQISVLKRLPTLEAQLKNIESQSAERLAVIQEQSQALGRLPGLEAQIKHMETQLTERLAVILEQGQALGRVPSLEAEVKHLEVQLAASEADREARREVIQRQGAEVGWLRGELDHWQAEHTQLTQVLAAAEADRAARLEVIQMQGAEIGRLQKELAHGQAQHTQLAQELAAAEADRAARLEVIQMQGAEIGRLQGELAHEQSKQAQTEAALRQLENRRAVRWLNRLDLTRAWLTASARSLIRKPESTSPTVTSTLAQTPTLEAKPVVPGFYEALREPKHLGGVVYASENLRHIQDGLNSAKFNLQEHTIDVADYQSYFEQADYHHRYPQYYTSHLAEKSLEHYLAAKLLKLEAADVYIDIASEGSPVPEIYGRLFGCETYRQDLAYPVGLNEHVIGGDAAQMPVPNEFASKMALHCSFEHFEGEADIRFIREVSRVLKPGGAVCIVPLYLFDKYVIQTDPEVSVPANVTFEPDAILYCRPGWNNRHGRFYDPAHLQRRVAWELNGMTLTIYRILNARQVDPSCYVEFAALITKPANAL